jgi:hypothetical protein
VSCDDQHLLLDDDQEKRIVVNGSVSANGELQAELYRSTGIFSQDSARTKLDQAEFRVHVNGNFIGIAANLGEGFYGLNSAFGAGDTVRISARAESFPIIIAEDILPYPLNISKLDSSGSIGENFRMYFHLEDPKPERNAYYLQMTSLYWLYQFDNQGIKIDSTLQKKPLNVKSGNGIFYSENNLVGNQRSFQIFTDVLLSGNPNEMNLIVDVNQLLGDLKTSKSIGITMDFRHLSMSTYQVLEGLYKGNNVFGGPFSSTKNIPDNIDGGYGLVQYYWQHLDTLYIP